MGSFAWKIAVCTAVPGGVLVLWLTQSVLLAAATVPAACLYGFAWEHVFGDPCDEEEMTGVGPLSTGALRGFGDSVYLTAPLAILGWIVGFVALLALGCFLHAAAMVGVTGVVVLIVRSLTQAPPHRRRRRRRTQPPS